jgi:methionyl-tRNA formyltransferase
MFTKRTKASICICGDGWGAIAALDGLALSYTDIVVVTNDEDVIERALIRGLKVASDLMLVEANLYVCAGLTQILKKEFLDKHRVLNIHYSLLPKYRGLHSTVWAILNDEPFFGLSIHEMNEFIDDGPILYQHKFQNIGQTSLEIMEACNKHISQNLSVIISNIQEGNLVPVDQNKSEATWVCRRNLKDCLIDFDQTIDYFRLLFKALVEPYPLPRVLIKDQLIEIVSSELVSVSYFMHNGRVVNVENEKAWVKVEDGLIVVSSVRDANTKEELCISELFKLGQRLR